MYKWLHHKFENRSIAEMSIFYCITIVVVFVFVMLLLNCVVLTQRETDNDIVLAVVMLAALICCLVFDIWLWLTLVKVARAKPINYLGVPIFKYMQIAFLVVTIVTLFFQGKLVNEFEVVLLMLLVFDVVVLGMLFVALSIAWCAHCKIPAGTYLDIGTIIAMFILQLLAVT